MTFAPAASLAGGPGRFSPTRGRMQNGVYNGLSYPSPFFDIAHTYLPANFKHLFRFCRYYFLTNPVINAIVFKMSEYPITDILIDHENMGLAEKWSEYLHDHLRYRAFQLEVGLDYFVYGNAFVSVVNPFIKYLICRACGATETATRLRDRWTFTGHEFRLHCPKCRQTTNAGARDLAVRNPSGVRLLRWNPEDIDVRYNPISGEYSYFYTIPQVIRSDITLGRKEAVEALPQLFIQAVREQKGIRLAPNKVFHLRRASLAGPDQGWGVPLLMPLLKDAFYLQVMKKAQESILLEHIVPLRTIFPQPASGTSDPFTNINLADWRDHIAAEIARWRFDPNYIPILPLPIGTQTIGGDGKALLLGQEMQMVIDQIIWGAGCPREFVMGGLSYAGSNMSLRMLENSFLGYMQHHKALLRYVMQEVAGFLDWQLPKARFKPFKMADDLQRLAYLLQLSGAGKISDKTLLSASDLDVNVENKLMSQEVDDRTAATKKQQLAQAQIQGEVQSVMMRAQAKVQQEMAQAQSAPVAPGEAGGPEPGLLAGGGAPGGTDASAPGLPPGQPAAASMPAAGGVGGPAPPVGQPILGAPANYGQQFDQMVQSGLRSGNRLDGQAAMDLPSYAMMMARQIMGSDPTSAQAMVASLQAQPELLQLVMQYIQQLQSVGGASQQGGAPGQGVDTRALPEQRAPRRDTPSV